MRVETITITDLRVTAALPRMPKLPPAVLAKLQADLSRRIDEMAYRAITGGESVRNLPFQCPKSADRYRTKADHTQSL